jgi:hypothetical protein
MLARADLDTSARVVLSWLSPTHHRPHPLHDGARDWPETNCYIDVWIEILHALAEDPAAALGFTVAQDFEGDHFTFSKFPLEDLYDLFGLEVQELAIYDALETHIAEQTARGRMVLVEVDSFFLPDTRGVSYRIEHTKTTIAVNRIDSARRELDYFHGPGFFTVAGDDYDGLLRTRPAAGETVLFPYAEFVKFEHRKRFDPTAARALLHRHLARRPLENPVAAFRARVRAQAKAAAERPSGFLHSYAFNTARQLGMNFELLGSHLAWLEAEGLGWPQLQSTAESCKALSSGAKAFQFQLARAVARKRFDAIETALDPLVEHYDRLFEGMAAL